MNKKNFHQSPQCHGARSRKHLQNHGAKGIYVVLVLMRQPFQLSLVFASVEVVFRSVTEHSVNGSILFTLYVLAKL
jgi:hypothetical protein